MNYFYFLFILIIFLSCSENNEIIIPHIEIKNGGIQKDSSYKSDPYYFNEYKNKKYSDIQLDSFLRSKQNVKRYLLISGIVKYRENKFLKNHFKSIIIQIIKDDYNEYFTFPIDNFGRFSGYLYFKKSGINKVYFHKFYDYLSYYGEDKINNFNTRASSGLIVNVLEAIPSEFLYLLPTQNIDCGNVNIIKQSKDIVKNAQTDLDKAKMVYEFLIFNKNNSKNFSFKQYKSNYKVYGEYDFHVTYIASQVLSEKNGVCNDYAELYAAMMRSLCFKIKKVWGYYNEYKEIGHMWNLISIKIDGKEEWYKVDPSWGNIDKNNYKKWAGFYNEYDEDYFNTMFAPYNHSSFNYLFKEEY